MRRKLFRFFCSLKTQLLFCYIVVSVAVLGFGSVITYGYTTRILKTNNENYLIEQFHQAEGNISNLFAEVERLSGLFYQSDNVQELLADNYNKTDFDTVQRYDNIVNNIDSIILNYSYINSIYLFTQNGGEIGASSTNTYIGRYDHQDNPFFSSPLYRECTAQFPKPVLGGVFTTSYYNPSLRDASSEHVISMARGVRPILRPNRNGTLVFNISEEYLASLYSGSTKGRDQLICIVDSSGEVVSSANEADVGSRKAFISKIEPSKPYGSFTYKVGKDTEQIVYYRLKSTEWYLVDEVPVNTLLAGVRRIQEVLFAIFGFSVLFIFLISFFWMKKITGPLEMLSQKMDDLSAGQLGITLSHAPPNEVGTLINRFNEMSLGLRRLVRANEKMQKEKIQIEIEALQAQINPHFIYNTLNMIKWMGMMLHAQNIVDSIVALGNLIRPAFKSKGVVWSIREELDYLENYLKIMSWRFGNVLNYSADIPEELLGCTVLKFILQPVVENTVTHGLLGHTRLDVSIRATTVDRHLVLTVYDNGCGIERERLEEINRCLREGTEITQRKDSGHVGLYNINKRIRLHFGNDYGVWLESEPGISTAVHVELPFLLVKKEGGDSPTGKE